LTAELLDALGRRDTSELGATGSIPMSWSGGINA
jgi:hypothetical protein